MYFDNCSTLAEVKSLFRDLAMANHPDRGGDTAKMQDINNEYAKVCKKFIREDKPGKSNEWYEKAYYNECGLAAAVNAIVGLEGIEIEVSGIFVWVSGDTFPHRRVFTENKFQWASKKKMWYWKPADYKGVPHSEWSIDQIRNFYGSESVSGRKGDKPAEAEKAIA